MSISRVGNAIVQVWYVPDKENIFIDFTASLAFLYCSLVAMCSILAFLEEQ
jgi:hypothetical protein